MSGILPEDPLINQNDLKYRWVSKLGWNYSIQCTTECHHPSIALWAGNNENELALEGYWYPEVPLRKEVYENEYRTLYIDTIEQIISEEDN